MSQTKLDHKITQVSIVVPTLNDLKNLKVLLEGIQNQSHKPSEILIIDSSSHNDIETYLANSKYSFNISYYRIGRAFAFDRFILRLFNFLKAKKAYSRYFSLPRAFPYEATNFGVKNVSTELVAFLDTTTIPKNNWLYDYIHKINNGYDLIFGSTKYFSKNGIQRYIHWSTWGEINYETMPGSIIKTELYLNNLFIREGVRAGGDVDWRYRAKKITNWTMPDEHYLEYHTIQDNLLSAARKAFIYQIHAARSDIQRNTRDAYTGIILFLSILIIPKWNSFIGWEGSLFFIPNITKIYMLTLLLFFLTLYFFNLERFKSFFSNSFLGRITKFSFIIMSFSIIYQWNAVIANWVEESILFIPHITKSFLILVIFSSLVYRGIYVPLKTGVKLKKLFPFRFIATGFVGLFLDIFKAPGYILGSINTFISKSFASFKIKP